MRVLLLRKVDMLQNGVILIPYDSSSVSYLGIEDVGQESSLPGLCGTPNANPKFQPQPCGPTQT